ncbi:MAG: patatin-like phospholipase family protein [Lachnospiraceae bacterium]
MQLMIDRTKEYGLVFDGGGARGAYQIGAWKALVEEGISIKAVAGTSVGALNGALVCMGSVEKAEQIWSEMKYSSVMNVDDDWMERFFNKENKVSEVLTEMRKVLSEGGIDIAPLRKLIHEAADEEMIRNSGIEFCLLTFSVTEFKELDLSIRDIPEGLLEDFLLASAYLIGFKNEKLHGKTYVDGGVVNNLPTKSLVKRGYQNLIQVRIYGPGRAAKTRLPKDATQYEIAPRVGLGSIIEFDRKRSILNMKIGYYDAKRLLYGLSGTIYYIEQIQEECYYVEKLKDMKEREKASVAFRFKLLLGYTDKEIYTAMLEASAKLLQVPKYQIYTEQELVQEVKDRYKNTKEKEVFPEFLCQFIQIESEQVSEEVEC